MARPRRRPEFECLDYYLLPVYLLPVYLLPVYLLPVLPKPPSPLIVFDNSSTSSILNSDI